MPTEVIMRVVPGGAMATNQIESDKLDQFRGQELMARFTKPRNLKFHKKYFALIGVALDMADTDYTPEQFRAICTVGAGYCDFIESDGELVALPRSIAFSSMDETEFSRLYQDTLSFICKKWALDENQINRIVDFM